MDLITANSNLQASSFSQMAAYKLFEKWGIEGLLEHCDRVSAFYRSQKEMFEGILKQHLTGLAEWVSPKAGMFVWLRLLLSDDPAKEGDSFDVIRNRAVEKGVLAVPGIVRWICRKSTQLELIFLIGSWRSYRCDSRKHPLPTYAP